MDQLIIFTAKYLLVASVILVAYFWLRSGAEIKKRWLIEIVLGGILALGLAKLSGHFVSDPRPFVAGHFTPLIPHADDNGFPSDHTLLTSFLGFITWPFSRRLSIVLLLIAAAVGAARVAAGIHHPLDIIGSFVIAAIAAAIIHTLWNLIKAKRPDEHQS